MPVLPLIDLMILLAWSSLIVAFIEKSLAMAMSRDLYLLGMGPFDWVLVAGVSLLFAIALAARVWVKASEPALRFRLERSGKAEVLPDFPDPREHAQRTPERASVSVAR